MTVFGKVIKSLSPNLYNFLVGVKIRIEARLTRPVIYITDSLGGNFKEYINEDNLSDLKLNLGNGMDDSSKYIIDVIVDRLVGYPNESDDCKCFDLDNIIGGKLDVEQSDSLKRIGEHRDLWSTRLNGVSNLYSPSVFYFLHGLTFLPNNYTEYIEDKDFIDLGAYHGDSVIAMQNYNFKKSFSLDISKKNLDVFEDNMRFFGIDEIKYKAILGAITSVPNSKPLLISDSGSEGTSIYRDSKMDNCKIEVPQFTLDELALSYDLDAGFIKIDIEGFGLHCIKGGLAMLKKSRPILSIAIYHNPFEFFEIKTLLDESLSDYIYMIRKLSPHVKNNHCHSEVVLLAYPKELL